MARKMNKTELINELSKSTYYSEDKCIIINEILESNFFISKKSKDKIIEEFILKLNVDKKEALIIYNTAVKIIKNELKNKLKHPFRSLD